MDPVGTDTAGLVARYRGGDRAALEQLMSRHYPRVERIVRVRLGTSLPGTEIADLVQEAMLRAVKNVNTFELRGDARFIHWLARLAENTIRDALKYSRARMRDDANVVSLSGERVGSDSVCNLDVMANSTSIGGRAQRAEHCAILDACLRELKSSHREVILLRDYTGLAWAEIADELGRPSGQAAQQLHQRARNALAERVRCRIGVEPD